MGHKRVLVLNADFSAIALTNWQNAILSTYKGATQVIDYYNDEIKCSGGVVIPAPAVIRLTEYVRPSNKKGPPFSRKNLFLRDKLTCQYCMKKFPYSSLTYDHVIPRSKWNKKGSPTNWENIVACCYPCNNKKGSLTLKEAKMKLTKEPKKPSSHGMVLGLAPWNTIEPEWVPYIPKLYVELYGIN